MMQTTHILAGMALALPVAIAVPELAGVALLAGAIGGAFPDLDLYRNHRKLLHYPLVYPVATLLAGAFAVATGSTAAIAVAIGLGAAALHCWMDILGGGLELRPWEGRSQKGVYDHVRSRWIAPRRTIGYDGSPLDLGIAVALAVPLLWFTDGLLFALTVALLAVSSVYVLLRKRLPGVAAAIARRVPEPIDKYVPGRYSER